MHVAVVYGAPERFGDGQAGSLTRRYSATNVSLSLETFDKM